MLKLAVSNSGDCRSTAGEFQLQTPSDGTDALKEVSQRELRQTYVMPWVDMVGGT